ncbi:MAG: hypothetical protein FWF75_01570 [Propionibacteriaceae bacterium]|nr:hypothetical protein [Propionibacteriaceae bacterium]
MRKIVGATIGGMIIIVAVLVGAVTPAHAATHPDQKDSLSRLVELNSGISENEMLEAIQAVATQTGMSAEDVMCQALAEP